MKIPLGYPAISETRTNIRNWDKQPKTRTRLQIFSIGRGGGGGGGFSFE